MIRIIFSELSFLKYKKIFIEIKKLKRRGKYLNFLLVAYDNSFYELSKNLNFILVLQKLWS